MDKAELGNKHICSSCGTKFYDLNKEVPKCPKCGAEIIIKIKQYRIKYAQSSSY